MIVGLPKEVQDHENRTALTPAGVEQLTTVRAQIVVETNAGAGSGFTDQDYQAAGARILPSAADVWRQADLVVKVKEPVKTEFEHLREGMTIFAYLHTPPRRELTQQLLDTKVTAIAYENVTAPDGSKPLLAPMSEIAGKMGVLMAAQYMQTLHRGPGVLLSSVPGLRPPVVVVLGGGVVGASAARTAAGLGCDVYVLELMQSRVRQLCDIMPAGVKVLASTKEHIAALVPQADVVVNCTLWPNPAGEHLVTRAMLGTMKRSAMIVDVSADPKGSIESSEHRTHSDPTFVVDGILHYCVPNLPGVVPRTSSLALTSVTLPYMVQLAKLGVREALLADEHFRNGLSIWQGQVTDPDTAETQGRPLVAREHALAGRA